MSCWASCSSSTCATSSWPSLAAICRGVYLSLVVASTAAPCCSSNTTLSTLPSRAAMCRGVCCSCLKKNIERSVKNGRLIQLISLHFICIQLLSHPLLINIHHSIPALSKALADNMHNLFVVEHALLKPFIDILALYLCAVISNIYKHNETCGLLVISIKHLAALKCCETLVLTSVRKINALHWIYSFLTDHLVPSIAQIISFSLFVSSGLFIEIRRKKKEKWISKNKWNTSNHTNIYLFFYIDKTIINIP